MEEEKVSEEQKSKENQFIKNCKNRNWFGLFFIVVVIALFGWGQLRPHLTVLEMKRNVAYELVDPKSADFRNIKKVGLGYCGEVNAKNRMGGYTGFAKFHTYKSLVDNKWNVEFTENIVNAHCS